MQQPIIQPIPEGATHQEICDHLRSLKPEAIWPGGRWAPCVNRFGMPQERYLTADGNITKHWRPAPMLTDDELKALIDRYKRVEAA